jgi:hypothetical protein
MEAHRAVLSPPDEADQSPRRPHARPRSRAAHLAERAESRAEVRNFWARAERFAEENRAAAAIILEDPERHGGEGMKLNGRPSRHEYASGFHAARSSRDPCKVRRLVVCRLPLRHLSPAH